MVFPKCMSWLIAACLAVQIGFAGAAAAQNDPVKVFILAGQSNMVGHGKTLNGLSPEYNPNAPENARANPREVPGGIGCLQWAVKTMPETYGPDGTDPLVDTNGDWIVRDDVYVYARMEVFKDKDNPGQLTKGITRKGPHTVGFGKADSSAQKWNGPEYGFGHIVGNALDQPVLIIKVATGGTALYDAWRSPTAVEKRGGEVGYMWGHMLSTVKNVLANLNSEFPELAGRPYEFVGFGWHQGYNDAVNKVERDNYGVNLVDFIADIRKEFGSDLPFVIGTTSMYPAKVPTTPVEKGQRAAAGTSRYTVAVNTRPFWIGPDKSPSRFGYHWNHNGIAHYNIGKAMGEAMVKLLDKNRGR